VTVVINHRGPYRERRIIDLPEDSVDQVSHLGRVVFDLWIRW
jgi:rare lipoprotein A (peptidoglycan hydrolase)